MATILQLEQGDLKTLHGGRRDSGQQCPECNRYLRVAGDTVLWCRHCKDFWKVESAAVKPWDE